MTKQIPQGYKQTKLGVIPEDWQVVKLGDIGKSIIGLTYSPDNIVDEKTGILVLRSSNIQNNKLTYLDNVYVDKKLKPSDLTQPDDILVCARNGSQNLIGKSAYIKEENAGTAFGAFMSIYRSKYNQYIFHFFQTYTYKKLVAANLGATINQITSKDLNGFKIPLPPLKEQEKIAEILSTWDDVITKQEQLIEQKQVFKKGIMQQIFSQKLRFKDDNGNDYPAWQSKKLGEISEIITGKTPSTENDSLWDGEVLFITPTDINDNKYQTSAFRAVKQMPKMRILPKYSIMFTCIASIGKMSLSIYPSVTNQQINSIIPFQQYNNEYIYYAMLSISDYIKSTQANTTLPIINKTEFSKFNINLPCLLEQTKIADFLTCIDDEITKQTEVLDQLKLQKQSLMQKLLTGQVRVKI